MKTAQEFASLLNGREYTNEITREEQKLAEDNGWLVIFGASDDLVEFYGLFDEEVGAYGGGSWLIHRTGVLPESFDDIESEEAARKYFAQKEYAYQLQAFWNNEDPPWSFKWHGPQPVHTFQIMDDGTPFCEGIVIDFGKEAK